MEVHSTNSFAETGNKQRNAFRIADIKVDITNKHFPNTSVERCISTNLLCRLYY